MDEDLNFGAGAGIGGSGGKIAVESRLTAQTDFANFVASLKNSSRNTKEKQKDRRRELYLVFSQYLNLSVTRRN